ncbi:MAG: polyprenyl synthetase family protein [Moraxella sp.]|nr:polyprenyl synthetase family protein [Moraxella sp.]
MLEQDLTRVFDVLALPEVLDKACRYAMSAGGKRIRPLLVASAFCALGGYDKTNLAMMRRAMMAVELLHGYSLVHDDLPCMDDDELRRGKPTCHIVFGEGVALLAGDVLQSLAFEVLTMPLEALPLESKTGLALTQLFAPRARRMVAGQMLDVLGEAQVLTQEQLERIHQDKTGALIEAAVLMGGVCAGATQAQLALLEKYAKVLGLAFQVQDDVLDVIADTKTLGKPAGSDEKHQKSTYVRLLGVEGASAYAKSLFDEALQLAQAFGEHNTLMALAQKIATRQK